jgi:signal peptidase I
MSSTPVAPPPVRHSHRQDETWLSSLKSLFTTVAIAVFVITFVVQAFQIPTGSMENTLLVGDYLLVDKVHFGKSPLLDGILPYHQVKRDDIVVFRYPVHPEQHFVKRVIGLPGDRIKMVHGRVFLNGRELNEPFVVHKRHDYDPYRDDFPNLHFFRPDVNVDARWWGQMHKMVDSRGQLIVPEGQYFVMGDNRDDSDDSRYWGFVPREAILGRPLVVYFSIGSAAPNVAAASDGKLLSFAYSLQHLAEAVRWHRCLRLVF